MTISKNLRSEYPFFCLLSLVWVSFFMCTDCSSQNNLSTMFGFAFGAGCFSYIILKLIGYFDPIRLLPRKSSLLLLPIAIVTGGYCQYFLFKLLAVAPFCSLGSLLLWTPVLSLVIFGGHYLLDWHSLKSGARRRIVLNLTPSERAAIIGDFATIQGSEHFDFLKLEDLYEAIKNNNLNTIDLIIVSVSGDDSHDVQSILVEAHVQGVPIVDYRTTSAALIRRIRLSDHCLWSYVVNATQQTSFLRLYANTKPFIEPFIAILLTAVFAPLLAVVAFAIKISSKGPVLYFQTRIGLQGAEFQLVKFRSMRLDAEKDGPRFASENDERITPIGKFIRATRLDELPQLWNVIKGEMSFFGPRPERPEIYKQLEEKLPMFWTRTIVKPGVTGWAQVYRGYVASLAESKTKLEFDLYYIQHMSPRLDFIILLKTIAVAICGTKHSTQNYMIDYSTPKAIDLLQRPLATKRTYTNLNIKLVPVELAYKQPSKQVSAEAHLLTSQYHNVGAET